MGRPKRAADGGLIYHVLNRSNARMPIFENDGDFEAFERVLAEAVERTQTRLLAYCVLSNHWHLVVWPREDGELSRFTGWLTLTHTQRWHANRDSPGWLACVIWIMAVPLALLGDWQSNSQADGLGWVNHWAFGPERRKAGLRYSADWEIHTQGQRPVGLPSPAQQAGERNPRMRRRTNGPAVCVLAQSQTYRSSIWIPCFSRIRRYSSWNDLVA